MADILMLVLAVLCGVCGLLVFMHVFFRIGYVLYALLWLPLYMMGIRKGYPSSNPISR